MSDDNLNSGSPIFEPFEIGNTTSLPGRRTRIEIPLARLPSETWLSLPIEVLHGTEPGPTVWLSAAIHGDELNGVEIIRQTLERIDVKRLAGVLIAVPVVNVFGFINQSRYLPDRRDLNRSFPGSAKGSLAARVAHIFMSEVVTRCEFGIDLHTGSNHRTNLPQIRGDMRDPRNRVRAEAFGVPVLIHSETRDGSLREACRKRGIPVLVYEAGEPLRFDDAAIELGVEGTLRVLATLRMLDTSPCNDRHAPREVSDSTWVRARRGGIFRLRVGLGQHVGKRQPLGVIANAFGDQPMSATAPFDGIVIGHTNNPLVNQGDALIHLARIASE
ncbi:aspartoacylase [Planctomycetes bacterium Pan216]|uniref:Aspartoacylase n=1 Tax=Kolteria novifilia TaxID=2527975 RepID=A0A518B468_9BACT|nr:aspartoacylase [Planctomycetes bacterium Pan216]